MRIVSEIQGEPALSTSLSNLCPYLTGNLLSKAIEIALGIPSLIDCAKALATLTLTAPDETLDALASRLRRDNPRLWHHLVISRVAQLLKLDLTEVATRTAVSEAVPALRAEALSMVATRVPEDQRDQIVHQRPGLLEAADSDSLPVHVRAGLAAFLPRPESKQLLMVLWTLALKPQADEKSTEALCKIALQMVHLGFEEEVLAAIKEIRSVWCVVEVLPTVVPHLTARSLLDAFAVAISADRVCGRTGARLEPHKGLPSPEDYVQIDLPPTAARSEESTPSSALGFRIPVSVLLSLRAIDVPLANLPGALVQAISYLDLSPSSSPSLVLQEIRVLLEKDNKERFCLKKRDYDKILNFTYSEISELYEFTFEAIPQKIAPYEYAKALSAIALRWVELGDAEAAILAVNLTEDERSRCDMISAIAQHLPDADLGDAVDSALRLRSTSYVVDAMTALAPRLPPSLLQSAFSAAQSIENPTRRTFAMARLASSLTQTMLRRSCRRSGRSTTTSRGIKRSGRLPRNLQNSADRTRLFWPSGRSVTKPGGPPRSPNCPPHSIPPDAKTRRGKSWPSAVTASTTAAALSSLSTFPSHICPKHSIRYWRSPTTESESMRWQLCPSVRPVLYWLKWLK